MTTHTPEGSPSSPRFPEAQHAGPHLVVDKTEWVPGAHPDPHLREPAREAYPEHYYRCVRCGAEALRTHDLPADCSSDGETGADVEADADD